MHDVLDPRDTVPDEVDQLLSSGYDLDTETVDAVRAAAAAGDVPELERRGATLSSHASRSPRWSFEEPDDLASIVAAMPGSSGAGGAGSAARGTGSGAVPGTAPGAPLDVEVLRDRIRGAWLARCAGCCLGKPVEGLTPEQIRGYLRAAGAWPLTGYVPLLTELPAGIDRLNPSWSTATRGRVTEMPRDDDTDYTVLCLHLLETYGRDYTPADVAHEWLDKLPFLQTFTAERAVYRNLVRGVPVADAATFGNPYREWIGALIRGDIYGYVNPGDPLAAARLAFPDASLSHTANGIYGEMWAAALIAGAFVADSPRAALLASTDWIPARTRLAATIDQVVALHDGGATWDDAVRWIDTHFADLSWVHTLNNAAAIAASLLWGGADIAATLGLTVQVGLDTDSATATVGSVLGALHGAAALPGHLVDPLHDRLRSAVRGYDGSSITALADRTLALAVPSAGGAAGEHDGRPRA